MALFAFRCASDSDSDPESDFVFCAAVRAPRQIPMHFLCARGVLEVEEKHAPPKELFVDCLADRMQAKPYTQSKGAAPAKMKLVAWCLSESVRLELRQKLIRADVVALHQDARQGVLLVRVTACCKRKLEVTSAVLGVVRDFGTTAPDILEATSRIVEEALAPDPRHDDGIDAVADFWPKVEVYDADGASDEQLAGRILVGLMMHPATRQRSTLAPNLRVVVRDRTHAATRIIKAPWSASEFLSQAFLWFKSFAKLLKHSPDLAKRFKTLIDQCPKENFWHCRATALMLHPQIVSSYVIQQSDQAAAAAWLRIIPAWVCPTTNEQHSAAAGSGLLEHRGDDCAGS